MKWTLLFALVCLLNACCFTRVDTVEYRQVMVSDPYQHVTVINQAPMNVTTTNIDYF